MSNEPRFEVFPETVREHEVDAPLEPTGEYGWHFRDANARITFTGGESFTRREDAHRSIYGSAADVVNAVFGYRNPETAAVLVKQMLPAIVDLDENGDVIPSTPEQFMGHSRSMRAESEA